ncbi:MAG: glycosyltransferase family 9 protein [Flavobacteriaceae bacterium]|nr:glycosyltransferase family 9 protein [Flavobacteriaceae bacterium]
MDKQRRILVFRLSSLGDIALCVPVIHAVLEQNPDVFIDFVAPGYAHDLFPKHARLELIHFDKSGKHRGIKGLYNLLNSFDLSKYEAIADLHDVLRTNFISSLTKFKGKKVIVIDKDRKSRNDLIRGKITSPLRHTTEKYADVFRKLDLKIHLNHKLTNFLFDSVSQKNKIGMAPFARHAGKRMEIEKLKIIAQNLAKDIPVYLFGSKDELSQIADWTQVENIHLCASDSILQELREMSELKLMITMDSANMHLAGLVGVPVLSIWGVTHPNSGFLGYGQSLSNLIQDESLHWRPTSVYGNRNGPKGNLNGMKNISAELVINKARDILQI